MITWMQTHKKWLIITIWIATIAFVGAGFVGWGAYSYGKKEDTVAKVKDTEIRIKDVQRIYNQLFTQLNQALGGRLDEATAKKFGLDKLAFQKALQNAVLMQFAKDNGIYVTEKDVKNFLASIPEYREKGNIKLEKDKFEALKKEILINKILEALNLPPHKITEDTVASLFLMKDKVEVKIIKAPKIEVTENELKEFWEKNKEKYKSNTTFEIGYYYVPLNFQATESELRDYYDEHKQNYTDKDGKILSFEKAKEKVKIDLSASKTKRDAIITMKKLKKNELNFKIANNILLENKIIPPLYMQKLIQTKFLKPVLTKKGWLIAKLIKINKPEILSFDKAKLFVKSDLINEKRKKELIKLSEKKLKSFKGINLGFIGKNDIQKVANKLDLSIDNATIFEKELFNSQIPNGYVLLPINNPKESILFKISEQKLLDKKEYNKNKQIIKLSAYKVKEDTFQNNLMKILMKIYQSDIKVYMKI
ncbi:MAG: hypothetical protein DSY40_01585 [Nautilia sp.]|nr:MAG: hypothetical protein DSY40_01585 [Nautilia sp.]